MRRPLVRPSALPAAVAATIALLALAPAVPAARGLPGDSERPLRYQPVDHGFNVTNGGESFNRPLYGGYTPFRADGGDRPEFSLYLPGRGGVLRVGLATPSGTKWLRDAATIDARYADAAMSYVVRDPAFGDATIRLTAVALRDVEGLAVRVEADGLAAPADVLFAFGGTSEEKSRRDGDIGTEPQPVAQFFALRPEHCRDNVIAVTDNGFTLRAKTERLAGTAAGGATTFAVADARKWDDAAALRDTAAPRDAAGQPIDAPAALATVRLTPGQPAFFVIQRLAPATTQPTTAPASQPVALRADALAAAFDRAVEQNRAVARQVVVNTPDPFVDAAVAAMNVAADALWDEKAGSVMHGGVAWRRRYLGWRGPYSGDATGNHDRTRRHLEGYFVQQNTKPIDPNAKGADEAEFLARSHGLIKSNGNLIDSHYDMNLVAVDTFFRHLLWTGDLAWAEKNWPVIERHFAWERRNFRRDFQGGPLYEAYAAIWASDDLQYNGGGVTHASAYNYWHNTMAARVAKLIGKDPAPYEQEADAIHKAMLANLWLADRGAFAEYKDLLGNQLVHPAFGLWTHYHTIDSHVPDALQAWQMCRAVEATIPRLPIRGPGVPAGDYATLASTSWMPYTWSINNVAMAEVTHTALADWQAGRRAQAMSTWKGAVLDSMFLGLCPGNLHMTSAFDAYRGESQRDSGDPVGATWRATLEGLFGLTPDALAGVLTIRPGFPDDWNHASIDHPDVSYAFKRDGARTTFKVESRFAKPMKLKLVLPASRVNADVTINGQPAKWTNVDDAVGRPEIAIEADAAATWDVAIEWSGDAPGTTTAATAATSPGVAVLGEPLSIHATAEIVEFRDPQQALANVTTSSQSVSGTVSGTAGPRTLFVKLRTHALAWWQPIELDVRPAVEASGHLVGDVPGFSIRRNVERALDAGVTVIDAKGTERPAVTSLNVGAVGAVYSLADVSISPGTNRFGIRVDKLPEVPLTVTNWSAKLPADAKLDAVDLSSHFNDLVTQVFVKGKYVSPRSPFASLAMPTQGFGGWATNKTTPTIDDSGLRGLGGTLKLPNGITFATPAQADAKNVLFVSQWDNYPREASVPLTGNASQAYLLMAGTTNGMQSQFDNGEVIVTYADGGTERLALRNPETWWPIDQDYLMDGHAYPYASTIPPRVDLKTGLVRLPTREQLSQSSRTLAGGSATVLNVPLDPKRELKSITVRAIANEVVIGLMSVTLLRP